jgi:hypothetical protein
MKSGTALLGSSIVMFSLATSLHAADGTAANTAATAAPPVANRAAPAHNMAATTPEATEAHATGKHARHATKHHSTHRRDTTMAAAVNTGTGDPAYRAALKNCVAGPEGRRDSCLDDAIARFGQS